MVEAIRSGSQLGEVELAAPPGSDWCGDKKSSQGGEKGTLSGGESIACRRNCRGGNMSSLINSTPLSSFTVYFMIQLQLTTLNYVNSGQGMLLEYIMMLGEGVRESYRIPCSTIVHVCESNAYYTKYCLLKYN